MSRIDGITIASNRAQRTRADIDYFDQRETWAFIAWKAFAYGVPVILILALLWVCA